MNQGNNWWKEGEPDNEWQPAKKNKSEWGGWQNWQDWN